MIKLYLFGFPCWRRSKQVWKLGLQLDQITSLEDIDKRLFDSITLDMQRSNYSIMQPTLKAPFNGFKPEPKHFYSKCFINIEELDQFAKYHGL
jgi:hypothetical protein